MEQLLPSPEGVALCGSVPRWLQAWFELPGEARIAPGGMSGAGAIQGVPVHPDRGCQSGRGVGLWSLSAWHAGVLLAGQLGWAQQELVWTRTRGSLGQPLQRG